MKYWFFDGNDVIGPFTPRELAARADFSVSFSLVCPENFSEDGDSWKIAFSFADFGPDALSSGSVVPAPPVQEPEASSEEAALFDKEMDTFLKNPSILAGTAAPAPEGPALEIPKKPAKPGPIEDYFNNINGEDLGDILGIPDPNENSDMNLPRVIDGPFEHTTPPADKEIDSVEDNPEEDESAAEAVPQQPLPPRAETPALSKEKEPAQASAARESSPAAAACGKTAPAERKNADTVPSAEPSAQDESREKPQPVCGPAPVEEETLSTCTLPLIGERENAASLPAMPEDGAPFVPPERAAADVPPQKEKIPAEQKFDVPEAKPSEPEMSAPAEPSTPAAPEELVSVSRPSAAKKEEDPNTQTVRDILRGELSLPPGPGELKEPLKTVPVAPRLNQVRTKLKQTPEIERFLNTQSQIVRRSNQRKANLMLWVLAALLAVGAILMSLRYLGRPAIEPKNTMRKTGAVLREPAVPKPEETLSRAPANAARTDSSAALPVPASPRSALETPSLPTAADKALAAVQNYQLPGGKGTVASYFDRMYKTQMSQGYTGEWSAEALHKNTYIVKYRLSKTRTEPIVYVFQADAARGKLTGALNNVALDLIGKI